MTAHRYVHDILLPHVLPLMQRLPGAIFQQDNARLHTGSVSEDCLRNVTTLPWSAQSPDLSPFEHIRDHSGQLVEHPTSLNELEASYSKYGWKCLKTSYRTCRGSLVVMVTKSRLTSVESWVRILVPLKIYRVEELMHFKSVDAQAPHRDVVWKYGLIASKT
ncbi:transposable element Tcb2 transposase [Trichonephila clavipes]|nr:transposable element Tcb2 transposase [Trichonephila clavipes]